MGLNDYLYPAVGAVFVLISPYVIVYEGNSLIGTAFAILGVSLLIDEWVKDSGDSGEDGDTQ